MNLLGWSLDRLRVMRCLRTPRKLQVLLRLLRMISMEISHKPVKVLPLVLENTPSHGMPLKHALHQVLKQQNWPSVTRRTFFTLMTKDAKLKLLDSLQPSKNT